MRYTICLKLWKRGCCFCCCLDFSDQWSEWKWVLLSHTSDSNKRQSEPDKEVITVQSICTARRGASVYRLAEVSSSFFLLFFPFSSQDCCTSHSPQHPEQNRWHSHGTHQQHPQSLWTQMWNMWVMPHSSRDTFRSWLRSDWLPYNTVQTCERWFGCEHFFRSQLCLNCFIWLLWFNMLLWHFLWCSGQVRVL